MEELSDRSKWIPSFIVTDNSTEVKSLIEEFKYQDVMLICSDRTDNSTTDFEDLVFMQQVKYIVSNENRTLKRKLKDKGKELIRLDDNFKSQKTNIEYLPIEEEKFSEEHMYYKEDKYDGFSDYTVLVGDYSEGGWTPTVVVIHLSYQKANEEIWIRHFTSISYDRKPTNIQKKFAEAAKKAILFFDEKDITTEAINELRKYYKEQKYPGLGMVKKISIKNHIELINRIIKPVDKL